MYARKEFITYRLQEKEQNALICELLTLKTLAHPYIL